MYNEPQWYVMFFDPGTDEPIVVYAKKEFDESMVTESCIQTTIRVETFAYNMDDAKRKAREVLSERDAKKRLGDG